VWMESTEDAGTARGFPSTIRLKDDAAIWPSTLRPSLVTIHTVAGVFAAVAGRTSGSGLNASEVRASMPTKQRFNGILHEGRDFGVGAN